jgi:hypothetical protein
LPSLRRRYGARGEDKPGAENQHPDRLHRILDDGCRTGAA